MLNYIFCDRYIVIPFVCHAFVERCPFGHRFWEVEQSDYPLGREWTVRLGTWRIYVTPRRVLRAQEERQATARRDLHLRASQRP